MNNSPTGDLLLFLFFSLVVIFLAYGASRLIGQWQLTQTRGRRLQVLEGVPIGRDRNILLVAVGKEVYLVGASSGGITLLHRITDPEEVEELLRTPIPPGGIRLQSSSLDEMESSVRSQLDRMRELLSRKGNRSDG